MLDAIAWAGAMALELFAWGCTIALEMFLFCFMARLLLGYHQANFHNPVSQLLVQTTDPLYQPLRRMLPPVRGWDIGLVVIAVPLKLAAIFVADMAIEAEAVLETGSVPGVLLFSLAYIAVTALYVYLIALIMVAVSGWMESTAGGEYFLDLACSLAWPILSRLRRVLPNIKFLDLSLMVALVGVGSMQMLLLGLAWRALRI